MSISYMIVFDCSIVQPEWAGISEEPATEAAY